VHITKAVLPEDTHSRFILLSYIQVTVDHV